MNRLLKRRGLDVADAETDPFTAAMAAAVDPNQRFFGWQELLPRPAKRRCAELDGYSLHAGVRIHENDREGLERLLCYGARAPLSLERLAWTADGTLAYRLRHPRPGASGVIRLTPEELLRRLAAQVPPPRSHGVRYHGAFAPGAAGRRALPAAAKAAQAEQRPQEPPRARVLELPTDAGPRQRRLDWAALLRRTFALDVLACERCSGRLRVMAFISAAEAARKILDHLGLPHEPPRAAPARDPPQLELEGFAAAPDTVGQGHPIDPFPAGDGVDTSFEDLPA